MVPVFILYNGFNDTGTQFATLKNDAWARKSDIVNTNHCKYSMSD